MLQILEVPTKCGSPPQSFYQNLDAVIDQDQDRDITLDLNTRTTFYT